MLFPLTFLTGLWTKFLLIGGLHRTLLAERFFLYLGFLPIKDHYYQPLINPGRHLKKSLERDRSLPGLDLNIQGQLDLINHFDFNEPLAKIPILKRDAGPDQFYYDNGSFGSGDAEFLFSMIRHFKPRQMIEVGCGFSTLMAMEAMRQNVAEDPDYHCRHLCIEPFEQPWLEKSNAMIIRQQVEEMDPSVFQALEKDDLLFIDSSHVIRPQGDVLFEILEILPQLSSGVLVHFHDIFTPRDYPEAWIVSEHRLWNEQYLLEAFLSHNPEFEILATLNHLLHHFPDALVAKCPILAQQPGREPGSFWIRKK